MGPVIGPHADYLKASPDPWADNVARWRQMQAGEFPEAAFTFHKGWFHGALRDRDDTLRAPDLGLLIARLMAREPYDAPEVDEP